MPSAAVTLRQTSYITLGQVPYTAVGDTLNTILFLLAVFAASGWSAKRLVAAERSGAIALFFGNIGRRLKNSDRKIETAAKDLLLLTFDEGVWLSSESLRAIAAKGGGEKEKAQKLFKDVLAKARESYTEEIKKGFLNNDSVRLIIEKL